MLSQVDVLYVQAWGKKTGFGSLREGVFGYGQFSVGSVRTVFRLLPLVCASGCVLWFLVRAHSLSWSLTAFFFFPLVLCRETVFLAPAHQRAKLVQLAACSLNKNNYLYLIISPKGSTRKWKRECLGPGTFSNRLWATQLSSDVISGPSPLHHLPGAISADVISTFPARWFPEGRSLLNCFSLCCFGSPPTWGRLLYSMSL